MKKDLVNIFIGSDIDANYISALLIDNQIQCVVQNTFEESLSAGWVSGSTYNSTILRVEIDDAEKAKKIIDEYLKKRNEIDESVVE